MSTLSDSDCAAPAPASVAEDGAADGLTMSIGAGCDGCGTAPIVALRAERRQLVEMLALAGRVARSAFPQAP